MNRKDRKQCGEYDETMKVAQEELAKVKRTVHDAMAKNKDTAVKVKDSILKTIESVRSNRDNVVMVRVSEEVLGQIDQLVDSGLTKSRSEAAALMISEGISARSDLFDRIAEQIQVIREAKDRLKKLLDEDIAQNSSGG